MKSVALDANWRWLHNGQYTNCYKDSDFNQELCPDPVSCARNCHLEGASQEQYGSTYGIKETEDGIKIDFVTTTKYGSNFGSRVYMMDTPDRYRIFKLKNREFTLTVDMFYMPCGLNGAVYFVEMDADGGQAAAEKTGGANRAGAKYGTGYCDAQCPHDLKFMEGKANVIGWNASHDPPIGKHGACCAEMDIWEANSRATAYTPHPCSITGTYICEGIDCGDNSKDERYQGVCDKDGCDFNSWRLGDQKFYGRGARDFKVDSRKKVTVVTQFITEGNRDDGDLIDIRRFYVQDGKVIPNSNVSIAGVRGDSITDKVCSDMKEAFGDVDDFNLKGGLKTWHGAGDVPLGRCGGQHAVAGCGLSHQQEPHSAWGEPRALQPRHREALVSESQVSGCAREIQQHQGGRHRYDLRHGREHGCQRRWEVGRQPPTQRGRPGLTRYDVLHSSF